MNGSCETPQKQLCGCCEGIGAETPNPIYNRPGLTQISYRVGMQASFKASLLAALSDSNLPALAPLRTRDDSDFTIALLDAWAVSLDILSFYQERLANEAYLGTAVDAASVMYLAQLVGYKPSPGVAASAFLAFTLSDAPGSPDNVLIPAGTRVQSVPKPGQKPQVFETSSDLTALIELNAIHPKTTIPWGLSSGITSLWLQGTSNNIHVGDGMLFVSQGLYALANGGSPSGAVAADFHFVTSVTTDPSSGNTLVQWDQGLNWPVANDNTALVYVFRKKAALFGAQAPDPRTLSATNNNLTSVPGWPQPGTAQINSDWSWQYVSGSSQVDLDTSYAGLTPADGEPLWTILALPSPGPIALYQITGAVDTNPAEYTLTNRSTQLTLANGLVLNVDQLVETWVEASEALAVIEEFSGFAVPATYELATEQAQAALQSLGIDPTQGMAAMEQALAAFQQPLSPGTSDQFLAYIVSQTRNVTGFIQSDPLTPADPPYLASPDNSVNPAWSYDSTTYQTQEGLLMPVEGSTVEIVTTQPLSTGQPAAVFGKRLRLRVSTASQPLDSSAGFTPDGATGSNALSDGQVFLADAFPPRQTQNNTNEVWSVVTTDGVTGTLEISSANIVLVPADKNDPIVGESLMINQVSIQGAIATLGFTESLARIYDRSTVTFNANMVAATNGETMHEILGNGDATNDALHFTLKQSPLTYVSSPRGMGADSTLQVWVNNLRWHEVDNFLESGPSDRVFVTQSDAVGKVTVQFGDGSEGARTPTGQMNIRAMYRKGIGAAGNVEPGQLSQALDRPQGLKGVTNPDPATGGADPDSAVSARLSAPLHVLTLERAVSLEDYQNYALAFAGIAKALATWTWVGRMRGVFLTVAGANGNVFKSDDPTITNLINALRNAGNPYIPLTVASYSPVLIEIGANVRVDAENYDPTQVLAQVWQSLAASVNFNERQPGQGMAQSEVIALMQSTPGVIAVELTAFNRKGQPLAPGTPLPPVLRAAAPLVGQQGTPQAAEMLLLDPASQGSLEVWS